MEPVVGMRVICNTTDRRKLEGIIDKCWSIVSASASFSKFLCNVKVSNAEIIHGCYFFESKKDGIYPLCYPSDLDKPEVGMSVMVHLMGVPRRATVFQVRTSSITFPKYVCDAKIEGSEEVVLGLYFYPNGNVTASGSCYPATEIPEPKKIMPINKYYMVNTVNDTPYYHLIGYEKGENEITVVHYMRHFETKFLRKKKVPLECINLAKTQAKMWLLEILFNRCHNISEINESTNFPVNLIPPINESWPKWWKTDLG